MIANLIMKEFFEHKIYPETNVKSQPKQEKIIKENVEKIRKLSNGAYEIVTKFLGGETKVPFPCFLTRYPFASNDFNA